MPEKKTIERARRDAREGKVPTTQAGEFVREEMGHVREDTHGARNTKQAIAIGLSKARRAGVKLPAPGRGTSRRTPRKAAQDTRAARRGGSRRRTSTRRSRATTKALRREGHRAASKRALSRQAKSTARRRRRPSRSRSPWRRLPPAAPRDGTRGEPGGGVSSTTLRP